MVQFQIVDSAFHLLTDFLIAFGPIWTGVPQHPDWSMSYL